MKLSYNCLMTILFLMITAIIVVKYDFFRAISIGLISLISVAIIAIITALLYCTHFEFLCNKIKCYFMTCSKISFRFENK